jgi:glycosyltransferase involved in cell wall biosynthesis
MSGIRSSQPRLSKRVSDHPRLSIGLPVYNGEKYLAESLEALLGQSYTDYELIISDNASTDSTPGICSQYVRHDQRIRYIRQKRNIGSAPNHNFVFQQSRGELFKWAAADDLYARDLLERCIAALDQRPECVMAHAWTAAFDAVGSITQALEYPLATDAPDAPTRFYSSLFGVGENDQGLIRADDWYGIIRSDVLRKVAPEKSCYHSDRLLTTELLLHGPFYQVPEWLYFRRDHGDRPQHASANVRSWSITLDPRRANRFIHPASRLIGEYIMGYATAIYRAPLSAADRMACYRHLAHWVAVKSIPALNRATHGGIVNGAPVEIPPPAKEISLADIVAGRGSDRV